jgi:hypothetical protein
VKPFKPAVSVAIGLFVLFVPSLTWAVSFLRHRAVGCLTFTSNVLLLVVGAGILLREWRKHRAAYPLR